MSNHTPGPWMYYTEPQPNGCPIVGNGKGLMVAMLAHSINYNSQATEAIANARLIAASPELLEALAMLLDQCERIGMTTRDDEPFISAARAAIAKATGEQQ